MGPSLDQQDHSAAPLPVADPAGWSPGLARALLLSYFGLFGVIIGVLGVLWEELKQALELSAGALGSAQLVSPLVAVGLLLQGGHLCTWVGKKRLALAGLTLLAASAVGLAAAVEPWGFVGSLVLLGAGSGLLETVMNAVTLDWEQATGRSAMNLMHAGFSGGAVLGAFGSGALLELACDSGQVLMLLALLCVLTALVTLPAAYPPAETSQDEQGGPGATLRLLFSRRPLVVLALLCLLGVAAESMANNWSVIYLRELGTNPFVGGEAFALFNGAMFAGRLANASVVAHLGPRLSLLASGAGLLLSALLLSVPDQVPVAVGAFAVMGLAVAGVVPTVLSATASALPGQSGAVSGGMMAAAYAGFILCPPLVGWLAELVSLQLALLCCAGLCGGGVLWLARGVRPQGDPG